MPGNNENTISVPASTGHLTQVREFVVEFARNAGFSEHDVEDIRIAVDEACTNIIKHAYKFDSTRKIQVKTEVKDGKLIVSLLDNGKSFNPKTYTKPNLEESIRSKKRGGMGIYLIKKSMNKVEYYHNGSVNEIRMTKIKS